MNELLEAYVRLLCFVSTFALCLLLEYSYPKRNLLYPKLARLKANLALMLLGTVAIRVLLPITAVTAAASSTGFGLLYLFDLPIYLEVFLAIISLDLLIYSQHLLMHKIPPLWRLHQVHHTDLELDSSSGFRFHPLEIILSMLLKILFVILLGAPVIAVVIFEVILSSMSLFNHSNIALPKWLDTSLRKLIVTPDMHRVHHSIVLNENNSNFGFNLSVWDKIFKTYKNQPQDDHHKMIIGLPSYRNINQLTNILRLFCMPFMNQKKD